jgi:ribonucleoside-diphosphate reductase alpha chain
MGVVEGEPASSARSGRLSLGKLCLECGNTTVIRKDGCDFCLACGAIGSCG